MNTPSALREHIAELLHGGHAHQDFDSAIAEVPVAVRGERPDGAPHSPWELLEHMRIAQTDILEWARGGDTYVELEFPSGYWPSSPQPPNTSAWDESAAKFRADHAALAAMVNDESFDLLADIPRGGATWLAKILLAADHNTYHLGQLVLVRRMLTGK